MSAKMVELNMNIITIPQGWYTVCAASKDKDFTVGLPKLFNDTYNIAERLEDVELGKAYQVANSYTLIVKEHAYDKANPAALKKAIEDLSLQCALEGVTKLAMPKICCGHNGLFWKDVKKMIVEAFEHMNIQILICA